MDLGTTFPDRMTHALEALVQLQPPSEEYRCHLLRQAGGNLLVEIEWDQRRHGKDLPGLLKFTLNPVPDPELAAVRLLGRLLRECKSLESQAVALAQACKSSEAATERSHAQLAEYCAAKQVKDGEIAAKAIALLLAKVDKD